MITHSRKWIVVLAGVLALTGLAVSPGHAADTAEVYVIQGIPDKSLGIAVDGKSVAEGVDTAGVVGPFAVDAGSHKIAVTDGSDVILERSMNVAAGSSSDIVLHLPVSAPAAPVATVFKNDLAAVPAGKASLTVAHTAAVPPADILVDGKVLFANVANGESLTLTVPAGTYQVEIVPTGKTEPVILGPLDLPVKAHSLNRVYAVGDPTTKTMNVAVHVITVGLRGSGEPSEVNTGTGGQAAGVEVPPMLRFFR